MDGGNRITRRRLLAGGLGGFGVAVGAISLYDPTTLRFLDVWNGTDHRQQVDVRVAADGDVVSERSFEIDENGRQQVPCEWPAWAGMYRYGARRQGQSEWTEATITDGGPAYRRIRIMEDGIGLFHVMMQTDLSESEYVTPCESPWWVAGVGVG